MKSPLNARWYEVENAAEVPTPSLLVYPDRVEANLGELLRLAGPGRVRPHVKTHKMSAIVRRQLDLGITRFKCATLAEAEMVARTGAPDVLLAMQPVGPAVTGLTELQRELPKTRFGAVVDNPETVALLSQAASRAHVELSVWIDLDCGMHRTGIAPGEEAARLYRLVAGQAGLTAVGLHAYDGHIRDPDPAQREAHCNTAFAPVAKLAERLRGDGLPEPSIIAGGSPTFQTHARRPGVECSPGTVVFWDAGYAARFPDLPFQPAACVICRVVSKPSPDLLCLDLGHKAIASENPHPRVQWLNLSESETVSHSEEHLVVRTPAAANYSVGSEFYGLPQHICPTVALYPHAVLVRENRTAGTWPVTARHRI